MVTFDPRLSRQTHAFKLELARFAELVRDMEKIDQGTSIDCLVGDAPHLDCWTMGMRPAACLVGQSTGHPVLEGTGRLIMTSDIVLLSQDRAWARTLSRWYRLGEPHPSVDLNLGGSSSWQ